MKLGIPARKNEPTSFRIYREAVVRELTELGVESIALTSSNLASSDHQLIWDSGFGLLGLLKLLHQGARPIVATIHGAAPFSLPVNELASKRRSYLKWIMWKDLAVGVRPVIRQLVSAVIAVSESSTKEVSRAFNLPIEIIHPIHHGVDHKIFTPSGEKSNPGRPYLLHVSVHAPKKNIERVFAGYSRIPLGRRPQMIAVMPKYEDRAPNIDGVHIIRDQLPLSELARWYRGALGLIFPSLHESFGMPIVEAMASGCPVVTSNTGACSEVAGTAALLVNPRSIAEISTAMRRLARDRQLQVTLRESGLDRARGFTWRRSAEQHLQVFQRVIQGAQQSFQPSI